MNIKWPNYHSHELFCAANKYNVDSPCDCGADQANAIIDACKKAVEEAHLKCEYCYKPMQILFFCTEHPPKQELTNGCPACGELYGKHNKRDKYKANFCFGNNDPFDDLMYEFANAHTEEYREEVFKNIKEMFKQEPALVPLVQENVRTSLIKLGVPPHQAGAIAYLLCTEYGVPQQEKPRPVVTVEKLADIVQNAGADWENLHDPITPLYVYIAQDIVEYLKEKE